MKNEKFDKQFILKHKNIDVLKFSFNDTFEIDNIIPISHINITRELPPYEKNGREIPVLGTRSVTTAIFKNVCIPIWLVIPNTRSEEKRSAVFNAIV